MADLDTEYFDVLDDQGLPTGAVKARAEVHQDGDWHRSFHLWIVREGRYVLFQRRARTKDLEPDRIDATVGGHYRFGETLRDVVREAEEEIGLIVRPGDLHFLFARKAERRYPNAWDREFQEVYVCRCEQPLEQYTLDCREVYVLYELALEKAIGLYRDGGHAAAAGWDCQQRVNNALLVAEDLIEQARGTTLEALEAIGRWLGEPGGAPGADPDPADEG